jgi:hypothetical protein
MSSYTITITPDDTTRASTTVRVDVTDNAARITELLVKAAGANGLAAQQLPAVDLDLLLRAIQPAGAPAAVRGSRRSVTTAESTSEASAPRRRTANRRQRGAKAAAGKAGEAPAKAAKATRAAAKKSASAGERAYRRAPDDLVQVFSDLGGVTAVAQHYGVPRHTAQSWVRRLRNEGRLPAGR